MIGQKRECSTAQINSNFENKKPFFGAPLKSQSSKSLEAWLRGSKEENHEELKGSIAEVLSKKIFWQTHSNAKKTKKIRRLLANNLQKVRSR